MDVVLLHLSDLHFGPAETKVHWWNSEATELELPERDRRGLLGSLVRDLEAQKLKPDVVIVSGDLLDRGAETGVYQATDFLKRLSRQLDLAPTYFVLAPGNHDVVHAGGRNRYARYDAIRDAFFGKDRPTFDSNTRPCHRVERVAYEELGLEILSLNSTEQLARRNRHGSIGPAQLDHAKALLPEPDGRLRVAVMHHHLETPAGVVRKDVAKMDDAALTLEWLVKQGFTLVLHGHHHVDWQSTRVYGNSFLSIAASASAGVGGYGRDKWSLPLGYQVLIIDPPDQLRRIRREYDPQHRRWVPAGRGAPEQVLHIGRVPASESKLPKPRARASSEVVALFDDILGATMTEPDKLTLTTYRAAAEKNEHVDLCALVQDLCSIKEKRGGKSKEFDPAASRLISTLALALADSMQDGKSRRIVEVDSGHVERFPVATYLLVEILLAHAQGREHMNLELNGELETVTGKDAMLVNRFEVGSSVDQAVIELERLLWRQFFRSAGNYQPKCVGPLEECEGKRADPAERGRCNESCHRFKLYGELHTRAFKKQRAYVIVEASNAADFEPLAARMKDVSFICFGAGTLAGPMIDELLLANLIRDFLKLIHPEAGTA